LLLDAGVPDLKATEESPAFANAANLYINERVTMWIDDRRCTNLPLQRLASSDPSYFVFQWLVKCANSGPRRLRIDLFFDEAPSHLHFANYADASMTGELIFTSDRREFQLGPEAEGTGWREAIRFIQLGVMHVLSGPDHLAFLVALLMLGGSLVWMVEVATGFTVAHSLTLALSVFGVVRPPPAAVEALVGLSIAYVSIENLWLTGTSVGRRVIFSTLAIAQLIMIAGAIDGRVVLPVTVVIGMGMFIFSYLLLVERVEKAERLRWIVAFLFGLVHGFAFAGALLEMNLPRRMLVTALFGFNAGVELGQLMVIAMVFPLILLFVHKRDRLSPRAVWLVRAGSFTTLTLGGFWFVTRAIA
jgi:hypothetical protein